MFKSDIELHGFVKSDTVDLSDVNSRDIKSDNPEILHIVIPYSNYSSFNSRIKLHKICVAELKTLPAVKVWIVEVALAGRPFLVTEKDNPQHVQLQTNDMIWHKESMINVCIRRLSSLCPDWKYVAWVDGDIHFGNKHIGYKTISQLQSYDVVQMFASVANLGPNGQIHDTQYSFCYQYAKNGYVWKDTKSYPLWHPGFAWACTREAYKNMGGLIDWAILGSADHHMARCLVGAGLHSLESRCSETYKRKVSQWQDRVERTIKRNIGYVEGTIIHGWHGKFKDRRYVDRWEILVETQYDPDVDIKLDDQGLIMLDTPKHRLRDLIRHYFDQRNEDSTEM